MVVNVDRLAEALPAWWPPNPDPILTTGGYLPPPGAPRAATPIRVGWAGHPARKQVLEIPRDVEPEACDGGEYRLWDDPLGRARTAQPGERIQLWIIDLEPGIIVLEAAFLPAAEASRVRELMAMTDSTWIGIALVR